MLKNFFLKACLGLLMLALAGSLLWYAAFTNRIAAGDWRFIKSHTSARLLPEAWYWWGNYFFYVKKDPKAAIRSYDQAIMRQPLLIESWMELVKTQLRLGNEAEARRIIKLIAPQIARTSYWKWKELLLSYDLKDEAYFEKTLNFILARSPDRIEDASALALRFFGSWEKTMAHLSVKNLQALMRPIMKAKDSKDLALLWEEIKKGPKPEDKNLLLEACQFCLDSGNIKQAKEMWTVWQGGENPGIYDGTFDMEPTNGGFGWRICLHPEVSVSRTELEHYEGAEHSLHFRFLGTGNPSYSHVSQIVPVRPGASYTLSFAKKSRAITTDQGVFLKVGGYDCKMAPIESRPETGTNPWEVEKLDVEVPNGCEALLLQVCRKESLKLDNEISGDYWLDSMKLQEGSLKRN